MVEISHWTQLSYFSRRIDSYAIFSAFSVSTPAWIGLLSQTSCSAPRPETTEPSDRTAGRAETGRFR